MKTIVNIAREILGHYMGSRASGHSHVMKTGLDSNPKAICIVVNKQHADSLNLNKDQWVSLDHLIALKGKYAPIAFDNFTLIYLLTQLLDHIKMVEDKYRNNQDYLTRKMRNEQAR